MTAACKICGRLFSADTSLGVLNLSQEEAARKKITEITIIGSQMVSHIIGNQYTGNDHKHDQAMETIMEFQVEAMRNIALSFTIGSTEKYEALRNAYAKGLMQAIEAVCCQAPAATAAPAPVSPAVS